MSTTDTIVIGGGHNGLICATLLAKAGQQVVLVEAAETLGGLAGQREFYTGFNASVAQTLYALPKAIIDALDLPRHGFVPSVDAMTTTALSLSEPPVRLTSSHISGACETDTAAFADYKKQLVTFSKALAPFWSKTMPRIGAAGLKDVLTFGQMGFNIRTMGKADMLEFFRVATLPMRDLVDEHFSGESLKAALCWDGLLGSQLAPRSPNQGVLTLLNRMAGHWQGEHSVPTGGMKNFLSALTSAATAAGVTIRTGTPVAQIVITPSEQGQHCSGVQLENGEVLTSERVVSSADPKTTFLDLVGPRHLEIEFSNRIRRLRSKGYVAKLHLALSELPKFTGLDSPSGRLILAPSMDTIEFAWDAAKYGELPDQPVMDVCLPTLTTPDAAPTGQHILSANVMYIPGELKGGWTDAARDNLTTQLISQLDSYAPGIENLVLGSELLTPHDLEQQFRVAGGHWHHVEPAIDQLLMMRPTYEAAQYATPIEGLYLCGSGSHPAGDISGNPGRNAAREILS